MFRFETPPTLRLSRGELISWRQTHGVHLMVQSGLLWVTRENDLDDHILRSGDSLLLPRGIHALIGAEDEASLRFEPVDARPRVLPNRWLHALFRARRAMPTRLRSARRQGAATVPG